MKNSILDKKALRISKVVGLNLIPIVGIFLFNWEMFEVAMTYLLETFVAFIIMDFDKYFIDKKTRVGVFFGTLQLVFVLPVFVGFIFFYSVILYVITSNYNLGGDNMIDRLTRELLTPTYFYIIFALLIFESIHYAIKNKDGRNHKSSTIWFNIRKIFIVHFFILISVVFLGIFHGSSIVPILFLILFKVVLDYAMEDELFFTKLRHKLSGKSKKE